LAPKKVSPVDQTQVFPSELPEFSDVNVVMPR